MIFFSVYSGKINDDLKDKIKFIHTNNTTLLIYLQNINANFKINNNIIWRIIIN